MGRSRGDETAGVPSLRDARWAEWTTTLHFFLRQPRTWAELKRWCKENRITEHWLRHMLAYLEERKLAASSPDPRGKILWYSYEGLRNAAE